MDLYGGRFGKNGDQHGKADETVSITRHVKRWTGGTRRGGSGLNILQHTARDEEEALLVNNTLKWVNKLKRKEARMAENAKVTLPKMPWDLDG